MPQIILKQPGQTVADFSFSGTIVTVAGVSVDCAKRQLDVALAVEIRSNTAGPSEGGNGAYLAQISIPARRYLPVEAISAEHESGMGQSHSMQEPIPLDPNAVQVTLWPTA
ncbi:hypothetical protein [Janthinobacterium sp. HLX7-2]|uniref:hypothetical protein n=1 Tax=Janthinobacterium sp. HLX7-2 TaxID=1259331 RepID=UPI003F20D97E